MKKQLVFASGNKHKLEEIGSLLADQWEVISMRDLGYSKEIIEDGSTLEENARIKAKTIYDAFNISCFADDSGLEISALRGAPGVYSARYAGEGCSFDDNNRKVLREMEGFEDRSACFRTVINLILDGQEHQFEGRIDGKITTEKHGLDGFGYDPIFIPEGYDKTFAEMTLEQKNEISHRAKAVRKLVDFLKTTQQS